MKATLDSDGRIHLPAEVQTTLGLKPGDQVILETMNGQCVIRSDRTVVGLCRKGNVLIHQGVSDDPAEIILTEARDERMNQLSEGISG